MHLELQGDRFQLLEVLGHPRRVKHYELACVEDWHY